MKYGICLIKTRAERWADLVKHAESLGFDSAWAADHLVFPIDMDVFKPGEVTPDGKVGTVLKPPPTMPTWDTTAALTYLAAHTSTIKLGTLVYVYGVRHPLVAARSFQTLDWFSGGRAVVGVGAGWLTTEWEAAGFDPKTRGRRTDEALEISRKLWTEEVIEHHGEFYDMQPVGFEPKPIQNPLPVHVGGWSKPAVRRVARFGQGWLPGEFTPETFKEPYEDFCKAMDAAGRSVDEIEISVPRHPESPDVVARWEEEYGVKRIILFPGSRATGGDAFRALDEFVEKFEVG